MKRKRSIDTTIAMRQLMDEMAESSIVTQALGRYLFQIFEFVFIEYIGPQVKRIEELEHQVRILGGKL